MKRNQTIFLVLSCFLLITSVISDNPAAKDPLHTDMLAQASKKKEMKMVYNQQVFVDIDETHYYEASISTAKDDDIRIAILDQDLKKTILMFDQPNPLVFVDAYQNIILVKQVTPLNVILSYYVLTINYNQTSGVFSLDYFAVNSYVDSEGYDFSKGHYTLTQILEYNPQQGWISVINKNKIDMSVYKINLKYQINVLIIVGWFKFNGQQIVGGNSKVLYDRHGDQLLVDTNNCRNGTGDIATIYNRVPICTLTKYPLYGNGSVYNLAGWYFQYASISEKKDAMTAFRYQGYGNLPIAGQVNLQSKKDIKYYYDDYNFFVAVSDCDIYITNVYWNDDTAAYVAYSNTLSGVMNLKYQDRDDVVQDWRNIVSIVFIEDKFYFITKNKFFVYGTSPKYFTKLYEKDCIQKDDDITATLFAQIKAYQCLKK